MYVILVQSKRSPNGNPPFETRTIKKNGYFLRTRKSYNDNGTVFTRTIVSYLKFTFRLCMTHHWKAEDLSKMALPMTQIWPIAVWWSFWLNQSYIFTCCMGSYKSIKKILFPILVPSWRYLCIFLPYVHCYGLFVTFHLFNRYLFYIFFPNSSKLLSCACVRTYACNYGFLMIISHHVLVSVIVPYWYVHLYRRILPYYVISESK